METTDLFVGSFNELAQEAHQNSRNKGFWEEKDALVELASTAGLEDFANRAICGLELALIHSETSEALEGIRKVLQDDHLPEFTMEECEMADVLIRVMDRAAGRKLRVAEAVIAKMAYNQKRPYKHGKTC